VIPSDARPCLAAKARLRRDRVAGGWLLLYPERGLRLNGTAADVLGLCTGEHTVAAIVDRLAARYGAAARPRIENEVLGFLATLAGRGLVHLGP